MLEYIPTEWTRSAQPTKKSFKSVAENHTQIDVERMYIGDTYDKGAKFAGTFANFRIEAQRKELIHTKTYGAKK